MDSRIEPELVRVLEDIVARRIKEELKDRAELVSQKTFERAMKRMDRRFRMLQKEMDTRFEATQKQMNTRFEATQQQMNTRFDQTNAQITSVLQVVTDIRSQLGASFEQFARNTVIRIL